MSSLRRPHQTVDYSALARRFPPPPEFFESAWLDAPEVRAAGTNIVDYDAAALGAQLAQLGLAGRP